MDVEVRCGKSAGRPLSSLSSVHLCSRLPGVREEKRYDMERRITP